MSGGAAPPAAAAAREVIQEWADGDGGYTFERGRMEKAVRAVCIDKPAKLTPKTGPSKSTLKLNKDDVEFIMKELMVTKSQAEEALHAHDGDLTKALVQLMKPSAPSSSSK